MKISDFHSKQRTWQSELDDDMVVTRIGTSAGSREIILTVGTKAVHFAGDNYENRARELAEILMAACDSPVNL